MNSLIEIADMEPPYVVQVNPAGGVGYVLVSNEGANITVINGERDDPERPLTNVKTQILEDGMNNGYLTITRDDLATVKKLCCERLGNAPLMTLGCYVYFLEHTRLSEYITFFKTERICCNTYSEVISYLHGLIDNGLVIEKVIVNDQEWFATSEDQLVVANGYTVNPTVWPDGEVNHTLQLSNGSVLPYINNNVYDKDDTLIYDRATRVILSGSNKTVKPFEDCPCCGAELYTMDYKKYCYSKSCSSLVESLVASLSKQVGVAKCDIYHRYQAGEPMEAVNGPTIDTFRTLVDTIGIEYMNAIISYFKDPFPDALIERAIGLFLSVVGKEDTTEMPKGNVKVLVCSNYSGVSTGTLSLLLKREGFEVTTCLREALFVIAGDMEEEFESFVNEDSNKLIVKLPPKELMRLLKK